MASSAAGFAEFIPWAALPRPGTVLNKDGSLTAVAEVQGPDGEAMVKAELSDLRVLVARAMQTLGTDWCIQVEQRRYRMDIGEPRRFADRAAQLIETESHNRALTSPHYETGNFFVLSYRVPDERAQRVGGLFIRDTERLDAKRLWDQEVQKFESRVDQVFAVLETAMLKVTRLLGGRLLSYLHQCVSDRRLELRVPSTPVFLDHALADTPLEGGLSPKLGRLHLRAISVKTWPHHTTPALLRSLEELPFEHRSCCRYLPLDQADFEKRVLRDRRHHFNRRKSLLALSFEAITRSETQLENPDATAQAETLEEVLVVSGDGTCIFGFATLTIIVFDEDESTVREHVRAVRKIIDSLGLVSVEEKLNAVDAFLGTLPGNMNANCRRALLSSFCAADLLPLTTTWSGPAWDDHLNAPPLALMKTAGSTTFRYCPGVHGVYHACILGPTGSGKTFLMNYLRLRWYACYHASQVFSFDIGGGARVITEAIGGTFLRLSADDSELTFQPLSHIDHPAEMVWAREFLIGLCASELSVTADMKEKIWTALVALAGSEIPSEHRTLSNYCHLVQDHTIRQVLEPYTVKGPYGHLFDGSTERSLADGRWIVFECEDLMNRTAALLPALACIFHRLDARLGATVTNEQGKAAVRLTGVFLDEVWRFLENSVFAQVIRGLIKTGRKKSVGVHIATQSLSDIHHAETSVSASIIDNMPTKIFLPNHEAHEPRNRALYQAMGLNEQQIKVISQAVPRRDYLYVSSLGQRLFQIDVGPIGMALCSGGSAEEQADIERLLAHREADTPFLDAYLRQRGIDFLEGVDA